jgi:glycosyltransferase involved in cell wall biosynthesis
MNHTRLICIARCKNEIKIIDKWIHSLPFVDLFSIVDNGSTDGTFEYLLNNPKVKLQKSQGFHEGRDFDLALTEARKYNPQWLLKLDCDEFFEKKSSK